jgi:hypothetical protein
MWRRLKGGRPIWGKKEKFLKLKIKKNIRSIKVYLHPKLLHFLGIRYYI